MSDFKGKKFIDDTNIATDEYIAWLVARSTLVEELEQKLENSRRSRESLQRQLEAYARQSRRDYEDARDYLEYQDDRFD